MLCSKFIALIAITLKVLFAFIKSHLLEKDIEKERQLREREQEREQGREICIITENKLSNKI